MDDTKYPKRASLEGLIGEIFKLVSRGATPEQWAEWLRVPLEHAAADGNADLFNALIGAGADGSAGWRGCKSRTLFDAAAQGGNAQVVSGLVAAGAQPDVKVVSASSGRSALYLATSLGHEDAARRLVLAGADVNFRDPADRCGVLTKATVRGCGELVNDLLIGGADPNAFRSWWEDPPLHIAAKWRFDGIVSTLLARGADKDALDGDRESPLVKAVEAGSLAVVNTLLAAGADVEVQGGDTPLRKATRLGHVEIMKAILGHGADVNAADETDEDNTALHIAVWFEVAGAIDVLIEAGADIERKTTDGNTPLCCSAQTTSGHKIMGALLRHGAKSEARNLEGNTPLHLACRERPVALDAKVDVLMRSGADETAMNNNGETPVQMLQSPFLRGYHGCSPQEMERAQLLLARAPNDRAWRRRCWLVMLRSRASGVKVAGGDDDGDSRHSSSAADGREEGGGSKMARSEHTGEGESGVVGQAGNGCTTGVGGKDGSLGAVVASLIGLGLEGVFRTVVGFL